MNKERLLNVAKALRESPNPEEFTMNAYTLGCNTPACAFGHYAYRVDLQDVFELRDGAVCVALSDEEIDYDYRSVSVHFGLTITQLNELFSAPDTYTGAGCGGAKTAVEAAEYIEAFVARGGKS